MMPLLVLHSVKSAGVTTAALTMAATARTDLRAVVVECDPTGGDIAAWRGLPVGPGLVELATATRSGGRGDADDLHTCAQTLTIADRSIEVVVAPLGGARSRVALGVLARTGQTTLRPTDRLVIADCGRLGGVGAPTWPLLAMADAVWVLARGRLDELGHLREHVAELVGACGARLTVVLTAGGVYGAAEVTGALSTMDARVAVAGPLPYDETTARVVNSGGTVPPRRWRRLPLVAALASLLDAAPFTTAAGSGEAVGVAGPVAAAVEVAR